MSTFENLCISCISDDDEVVEGCDASFTCCGYAIKSEGTENSLSKAKFPSMLHFLKFQTKQLCQIIFFKFVFWDDIKRLSQSICAL